MSPYREALKVEYEISHHIGFKGGNAIFITMRLKQTTLAMNLKTSLMLGFIAILR